MTNIYNLIQLEYEKKRLRNYHEQQKRLVFVYSKIPQIEQIDYDIKKLGVKCNLQILNKFNKQDTLKTLKERISFLEDTKKNLLVANGFSSDFLDVKYDCLKCNDTGLIQDNFSSQMCPCFKQKYVNYIFGQSNLATVEKENFNTFDISCYSDEANFALFKSNVSPRQNALSIKDVVLKFIQNFDIDNCKNLLFTGNTGVGKTFMLNCIAYELLKKEKTVIYKTASELFDTVNKYKLQSATNSNFNFNDYQQIFTVDLLIIDDLGAETKTNSKYSELLNILNKRQLDKRKTVISTNFSIKEIYEEYTERVYSRLIENFELLRLFGDDIRILKARGLT